MKPVLWIVGFMLLISAAMLVMGIGASGLWIAVIAVGIALVAVAAKRPSNRAH